MDRRQWLVFSGGGHAAANPNTHGGYVKTKNALV